MISEPPAPGRQPGEVPPIEAGAASAPDPARRAEVAAVLDDVRQWAQRTPPVLGIALVGSWARGTPTTRSDVDLVLVLAAPGHLAHATDWLSDVLPHRAPRVVRTARWGPLRERRVRLAGGLDVEFGLVPPSWAATTPVDAGTARVVREGLVVLHDPAGLFERLVAAVAGADRTSRPP